MNILPLHTLFHRTHYSACRRCGSKFQLVDFLPYRAHGYCTKECLLGSPRGIPSDESIAFKDCLTVPHSLKPKHEALSKSNESLPRMIFDMVRYPHPIGWRIENWRIIEDDSKEKGRFIDKMGKKTA